MSGHLRLDGGAYLGSHLVCGLCDTAGDDNIKNEVGVARPCDHAEIMHADDIVNSGDDLQKLFVLGIDRLVVAHDGIHMYRRFAAEIMGERALDDIDGVVQLKDIFPAVDLGMQTDHEPARAVIVHDKIVHTDYLLTAHNDMLYLLHEAPPEEQTFEMLMFLIENAATVEDDEDGYQSPVDILFNGLEEEKPELPPLVYAAVSPEGIVR